MTRRPLSDGVGKMPAHLISYMNTVAIQAAAISPSTIRTTGLIFMGFGVAYLIYRWFRDR